MTLSLSIFVSAVVVTAIFTQYFRRDSSRSVFAIILIAALIFKTLVVWYCNTKNISIFGVPYFPGSDIARFLNWTITSDWENIADPRRYASKADPGIWLVYSFANRFYSEPVFAVQVLLLAISLLIPIATDFLVKWLYHTVASRSQGEVWPKTSRNKVRVYVFAFSSFYPSAATLIAFPHKELIVTLFFYLALGALFRLFESYRLKYIFLAFSTTAILTYFRLEMIYIIIAVATVTGFLFVLAKARRGTIRKVVTVSLLMLSMAPIFGIFALSTTFSDISSLGNIFKVSGHEKMVEKDDLDLTGVGGLAITSSPLIRYPMGIVSIISKPFPPYNYIFNYSLPSYYVYDSIFLLATLPVFAIGCAKAYQQKAIFFLVPLAIILLVFGAMIYSHGGGNIRYRTLVMPLYFFVLVYGWQFRRRYSHYWLAYILAASGAVTLYIIYR